MAPGAGAALGRRRRSRSNAPAEQRRSRRSGSSQRVRLRGAVLVGDIAAPRHGPAKKAVAAIKGHTQHDVDDAIRDLEFSAVQQIITLAYQLHDASQYSAVSSELSFGSILAAYEQCMAEQPSQEVQLRVYERLLRMNAGSSAMDWWSRLEVERSNASSEQSEAAGIAGMHHLALLDNSYLHNDLTDLLIDRLVLDNKLQLGAAPASSDSELRALRKYYDRWTASYRAHRTDRHQRKLDASRAASHHKRLLLDVCHRQWTAALQQHRLSKQQQQAAVNQYQQSIVQATFSHWKQRYRLFQSTELRCATVGSSQADARLLRSAWLIWRHQYAAVCEAHAVQQTSAHLCKRWSQHKCVRRWKHTTHQRLAIRLASQRRSVRERQQLERSSFRLWQQSTHRSQHLRSVAGQVQRKGAAERLQSAFLLWLRSSKRHRYCVEVSGQRYEPMLARRVFRRWLTYRQQQQRPLIRHMLYLIAVFSMLERCSRIDLEQLYQLQTQYEAAMHDNVLQSTDTQRMTAEHVTQVTGLLHDTLSYSQRFVPVILRYVYQYIQHRQLTWFQRWRAHARARRIQQQEMLISEAGELQQCAAQVATADSFLMQRLTHAVFEPWKQRTAVSLMLRHSATQVLARHQHLLQLQAFKAWVRLRLLSQLVDEQSKRRAVQRWRAAIADRLQRLQQQHICEEAVSHFQVRSAVRAWRRQVSRKRTLHYTTLLYTVHHWRHRAQAAKSQLASVQEADAARRYLMLHSAWSTWSATLRSVLHEQQQDLIAKHRHGMSSVARTLDTWKSAIQHARQQQRIRSMLTDHAQQSAKHRALRQLASYTVRTHHQRNQVKLASYYDKDQLRTETLLQWRHVYSVSRACRVMYNVHTAQSKGAVLLRMYQYSIERPVRDGELLALADSHAHSMLQAQAFNEWTAVLQLQQRLASLQRHIERVWSSCLQRWCFKSLRHATLLQRQRVQLADSSYAAKQALLKHDAVTQWRLHSQKIAAHDRRLEYNRRQRAVQSWRLFVAASKVARDRTAEVQGTLALHLRQVCFKHWAASNSGHQQAAYQHSERRTCQSHWRRWQALLLHSKRVKLQQQQSQQMANFNTCRAAYCHWTALYRAHRARKQRLLSVVSKKLLADQRSVLHEWHASTVLRQRSEQLRQSQDRDLTCSIFRWWKRLQVVAAKQKLIVRRLTAHRTRQAMRGWLEAARSSQKQAKQLGSAVELCNQQLQRAAVQLLVRHRLAKQSRAQLLERAEKHVQRRTLHHWALWKQSTRHRREQQHGSQRKVQSNRQRHAFAVWQHYLANADSIRQQEAALELKLHHQATSFQVKRVITRLKRHSSQRRHMTLYYNTAMLQHRHHATRRSAAVWHAYAVRSKQTSTTLHYVKHQQDRHLLTDTFHAWRTELQRLTALLTTATPQLSLRLMSATFHLWSAQTLVTRASKRHKAVQCSRHFNGWQQALRQSLHDKARVSQLQTVHGRSLLHSAWSQWTHTLTKSAAIGHLQHRITERATREQKVLVLNTLQHHVAAQQRKHVLLARADTHLTSTRHHAQRELLLVWQWLYKQYQITAMDRQRADQHYRRRHARLLTAAVHQWHHNVLEQRHVTHCEQDMVHRINMRRQYFVLSVWHTKAFLQRGFRSVRQKRTHAVVLHWLQHVKRHRAQQYLQTQVEKHLQQDALRLWHDTAQQALLLDAAALQLRVRLQRSESWRSAKLVVVPAVLRWLQAPESALPFYMLVWQRYNRHRKQLLEQHMQAEKRYLLLVYRTAFGLWQVRLRAIHSQRQAEMQRLVWMQRRGIHALQQQATTHQQARARTVQALQQDAYRQLQQVFHLWARQSMQRQQARSHMHHTLQRRYFRFWLAEMQDVSIAAHRDQLASQHAGLVLVRIALRIWQQTMAERLAYQHTAEEQLPGAMRQLEQLRARAVFGCWHQLSGYKAARRLHCAEVEQLLPMLWQRSVFLQWRRHAHFSEMRRERYVMHRSFVGWKLAAKRKAKHGASMFPSDVAAD